MQSSFAVYKDSGVVLVFDSETERDTFVNYETLVHPDCRPATFEQIANLIEGKSATWDRGFGCYVFV